MSSSGAIAETLSSVYRSACGGCVVTALGAILLLRIVYEIVSYVWLHFLRPATSLSKYGARKGGAGAGAWAVVTGATGGIGEGFAEVLAARGFNVVLVSRREDQLKALAQQIEAKSNVKTQIVPLDCGRAGPADFAHLNEVLSAVNLSVVINNVGVNTATPNELDAMTEDEVNGMLSVNATFTAKFTKLVIPILKKRDTAVAPRAAILHLSSFSGVFPAGLMAIYSATKAFADGLGRALSTELASHKIDSASVVAHYVVSAMSGFDRPSLGVPTAAAFAKTTLAKLGAGSQLIPHWHHDAMARIIRLLPESFVATKTYGMMKAVRRALSDPERAKKRAARREAAEAKKAAERAKYSKTQ